MSDIQALLMLLGALPYVAVIAIFLFIGYCFSKSLLADAEVAEAEAEATRAATRVKAQQEAPQPTPPSSEIH